MKTNFFKIALRYLWRKKTYSILNLFGLTFGLTCAIIASLHILNTLNFDKFHKNFDRLYAVESYVPYFDGNRFPKEKLSASLNDALKEKVPEIEEMTRITHLNCTFLFNDKSFTESGIYADNNFFDLFTFPLLKGNSGNMLTDVQTILISERMAKKFFENDDCIGKTLTLKDGDKQEAFKIAGVLRDVPAQSSFQFDYIIPFSKFLADNSWANESGASSNQIWVLLKKNADKKFVDNKIKNLIKNQESNLNQELFLFPLKDKILYYYIGGRKVWKEMQYLVIVGSLAFAILLIACFNFINLAIALNIKRYREAGIKKVVGSSRSGIIFQFLRETFLITLISFFSAILITKLLLTGFNTAFNNNIHFSFSDVNVVLVFTVITLFTGLISGLLPSLYLASSNPLNVIKGKIVTSHSYSSFRQGLIVFQFVIPIVLIICMMVIKTQDKRIRNYDFGVDKEKVIVLDNSLNIKKHAESVKTELLSIPGIDAVSYTSCIPTRGTRSTNDVSWDGKEATEKMQFWCVDTDFDYNKTVKIKMIKGRFFDKSFSSDSSCYLINDMAARLIKNEKPIGASFSVDGKNGTIIGVFSDFYAVDLSGAIVPTIMQIKPNDVNTLLIKFSSGTYPEIAGKISKVFKNYEPELPFQPKLFRHFADSSELNASSRLIGVAFIIALLMACLGLFGLASFTAESRTKEIGIRKANGATTLRVIQLLLTNYSKWLIIAFFIALPFAYLLGHTFLRRFHFHSSFPYWTLFVGPIIAYIIALSTVGWQSWRAASKNPVEALRYE